MMDISQLVIIGAGGFSREVICWAEDAARAGTAPPIRGYLVDPEFPGISPTYGLPRLAGLDDYSPVPGDGCVIAVSDPGIKRDMVQRLRSRGAWFATVVHPTAVVARTAVLGEGVVVCPHAGIAPDTVLGDFVTFNAMSTLGHDSRLGDYSTLSGHVDITGWVTVGEGVFFGSGARVLPGLTIGNGARIGAGAVIVRSVPEQTTMYTSPARRLS